MQVEPVIQIAAVEGAYIVSAIVRCDCGEDDCGGWKEKLSGFGTLGLAIKYAEEIIKDYESRPDDHAIIERAIRRDE